MKLSITDWQKATNARVLVGTITSLDGLNNKATITIGAASVADVPIHYWCHHGVDNHAASLVFKSGDQVKAIYTGNGAALSNANLTILGLNNEIRRCTFLDGLIITTPDGIWTLKGSTATPLISGQDLAGRNWWSNGTSLLSWDMPNTCRYARGCEAGGPSVYRSGVEIARFDGTFAGAGLRTELDGEWVYVTTAGGYLYKKKVGDGDPSANWVTVGAHWVYATAAATFDSTCSKFCCMESRSDVDIAYEVSFINGISVTQVAISQNITDSRDNSYPVAVDYVSGFTTLSVATVQLETVSSYSWDVTTLSNSYDKTVGDTDYYLLHRSATEVSSYRPSLKLMWPTKTHLIYDFYRTESRYSTTYNYGTEDYINGIEIAESNLGNGTDSYYEYEYKLTSNLSSLPLMFDMRDDLLLTYEVNMSGFRTFDSETWDGDFITRVVTSVGTTHEESAQFSTARKKDDTALKLNSIPCHVGLDFTYADAGPETYFDPVTWELGVSLTASSVLPVRMSYNTSQNTWGSGYHPLGLLGIDADPIHHIKHPITLDTLTFEKLSTTEQYLVYSGGDVATLTGGTAPINVQNLRIA